MEKHLTIVAGSIFVMCTASIGCSGDGGSRCGPTSGVVEQVIDGDTIDLVTGERIRYLMVDTPEISGTPECYGIEARDFNRDLVQGQSVTLTYDVECTDRFDRTLAYVSVQGREVNSLLVERGYACVLYLPPNGEDRRSEFQNLEALAQAQQRGMWAACPVVACTQ